MTVPVKELSGEELVHSDYLLDFSAVFSLQKAVGGNALFCRKGKKMYQSAK